MLQRRHSFEGGSMSGSPSPGRSPRAVRHHPVHGGCSGGSRLRLLLAAAAVAVALLGLGGRVGAANPALDTARRSQGEAMPGPTVTLNGFPGPSSDGVARLPQVGAMR
ncbi:hypothetical protein ABPG75_002422 [Micractinium tetrahymenae]